MPKATQLNLKLENQIGALAGLCRDLAHAGVNLLALCTTNEESSGSIRLLVTNRELAENALSKEGYSYSVEEVVFVELKNRPGTLAKTVEKLARDSINVRYAYATAYTKAQLTGVVIAVADQDLERAVKLLG
jgi:hypothetical protein